MKDLGPFLVMSVLGLKAKTFTGQYSLFVVRHAEFEFMQSCTFPRVSTFYVVLSDIAACHKVFKSFHQNCKQSNGPFPLTSKYVWNP